MSVEGGGGGGGAGDPLTRQRGLPLIVGVGWEAVMRGREDLPCRRKRGAGS